MFANHFLRAEICEFISPKTQFMILSALNYSNTCILLQTRQRCILISVKIFVLYSIVYAREIAVEFTFLRRFHVAFAPAMNRLSVNENTTGENEPGNLYGAARLIPFLRINSSCPLGDPCA